ncbi:RNA polymerase sporulation-specific sigma factor [Caloramator quimbayensis]|uniref:RNA polymerase sporulation-specific sigma factor n=1 Tax=Caloramator quimbayensis TaxID=1147123 RepID=A0A1T4X431_9CLOT|nr:sigma-70 family RNA polymerase sigma factor [Caloramator quimbayensis]SKA84362.1 RNA polymerase sporulation-specific sigma factor [Caloramator quimbayensis]
MREKVAAAREDEKIRLEIIKSFEPLIKKCFKYYVKDLNYFNDAMQEGYLIVLMCIYNYDFNKEYPFEGYVKSSVIYGIKNFARKIKYNVSLDEPINEDEGCLYDVIESDLDVEGEFEHRDNIKNLKAALNKLSEKQRGVIDEIYFKNKNMREICKNRRCHYMTVEKLKERAIKVLREQLG